MRPNLQEGIWAEWSNWKHTKFKGGWLWRTSPRSTIHWFDIGQSVGIYSTGRAVNGSKAVYWGYVKTPGIAIVNISFHALSNLDLQVWNYYVPNLFNTLLPKIEWKKKGKNTQWMAGIQYFWQQSLYNDTLSIEKQYITTGEQAHAFSTRISHTNVLNRNEWSFSYTRITKQGRFLFPREWGVEPFYTYMSRERMEGAGDVNALMVQNNRTLDKAHHLSLQSSAGLFWMPSVNNARLNKYTIPSFYHFNLRTRYTFSGFMQGLQAEVLYTYKGNLDSDLEAIPENFNNKVDMHHVSLVMNYYF
jgi:hypothetical protein